MADLLVSGTLHTLDPGRPAARAALIRDGRFAKVGTRQECEGAAGSDLRFIELGEGCAVPGLIDAHGHPLLHARTLTEVRLAGATSEKECVERVARFASTLPEGGWVRGSGWDQNLWTMRDFPGASLLSAATPRHPVALSRIDAHALWCNDNALRAAGIVASTPDPPGGRIVRRDDGMPTGVLIDTAMDLVLRAVPGSRLLLKHFAFKEAEVRDDVMARLEAFGADPALVTITPPEPSAREVLPWPAHLSSLSHYC